MALLFLKRTNLTPFINILRLGARRCCSTETNDQPVKFSTSQAARWRAEFTRSGEIYDDTPDSQPITISISLAVFMLYFFVLREESDIDEDFDLLKPIYDKVDGLEEVQLKLFRKKKVELGEDTTVIDERLSVLIQEREAREGKGRTNES